MDEANERWQELLSELEERKLSLEDKLDDVNAELNEMNHMSPEDVLEIFGGELYEGTRIKIKKGH